MVMKISEDINKTLTNLKIKKYSKKLIGKFFKISFKIRRISAQKPEKVTLDDMGGVCETHKKGDIIKVQPLITIWLKSATKKFHLVRKLTFWKKWLGEFRLCRTLILKILIFLSQSNKGTVWKLVKFLWLIIFQIKIKPESV